MPKEGVFVISNEAEAIDAWSLFFARFFSPVQASGADGGFDPEVRRFVPRAKGEVNSKESNHSDDFDDFLNGNTVAIPDDVILNSEGLERVKNAIDQGDFDDESLKNKDHVFYALCLFKENRISRQQMSTILGRAQVGDEYPITKTFQILDDQGQFTPEAKKYLLPLLKKNALINDFSKEHLERFRLLIQAAPKSEQMFYISKPNPKIMSPDRDQLGDVLQGHGAWHKGKIDGGQHDIHLSFGVIEARQIAIKGYSAAAAVRTKLGKISIDAIKDGVNNFYRYTAISIEHSGVAPTTKGIHNFQHSPMPVVTQHDVFHAKLFNTIPSEFHMALNHMVNMIADHTHQKWSKTMWEMVDREFYYNARTLEFPKDAEQIFMQLLLVQSEQNFGEKQLFISYGNLDDEGVAIVWNMVNNREAWKNLYKIDLCTGQKSYFRPIQCSNI